MRWTLRIAVALGAAFLALTAIFLLSLVAVPVLPRTLGLSEPVRSALRPHLPVPPTRARSAGHAPPRPDRHREGPSPDRRRVLRHLAGDRAPLAPRERGPDHASLPALARPLGRRPPYRHARLEPRVHTAQPRRAADRAPAPDQDHAGDLERARR